METDGEKQATKRRLADKIEGARGIVSALDRALQTRRLYPPQHQLYIEATEDLVKRTLDFFKRYEYLRADIRSDGLMFEDEFLLKGEEREMQIPLRLYKDGIRVIRFRQGISREEILDFLGLFETNAKDLQAGGEDLVSLIWNQDAPCIDYAVVDEFESEDTGVMLTARQIKESREVVQSLTRISESLKTLQLLPGSGGTPGTALPREAKTRTPVALTENDVDQVFQTHMRSAAKRLWKEIEYETFDGAIRRSFEILFRIFEEEKDRSNEDLAPLVGGVAWIYLRKQDLGALGHFLESAGKSRLLQLQQNDVSLEQEVRQEIDSVVTPAVLRRYVTEGFNGDYEGFGKFLEFLGPDWVARVGAVYGESKDAVLREHMRRYLIRWKDRIDLELCRQMYSNTGHCRREILQIFEAAAPPGILKQVAAYFPDLVGEIRIMALDVIIGLPGPEKVDFISKALRDPDVALRSAAYRCLADSHSSDFRAMLQDFVQGRDFVKLEGWEKSLAWRALVSCSGVKSVALVRRLVESKSPRFNKAKHEESRRAAVLALAGLDIEEANSYLRTLGKSGDDSLRGYVQEVTRIRERHRREP